MSKLVTFKWVNVPVIDNVSARMSLTNNVFPILTFPPTDKLSFNEASPEIIAPEFKVVIPSTVKVPLSMMFLDTAKFPLIEASEETKSFELRETSLVTKS